MTEAMMEDRCSYLVEHTKKRGLRLTITNLRQQAGKLYTDIGPDDLDELASAALRKAHGGVGSGPIPSSPEVPPVPVKRVARPEPQDDEDDGDEGDAQEGTAPEPRQFTPAELRAETERLLRERPQISAAKTWAAVADRARVTENTFATAYFYPIRRKLRREEPSPEPSEPPTPAPDPVARAMKDAMEAAPDFEHTWVEMVYVDPEDPDGELVADIEEEFGQLLLTQGDDSFEATQRGEDEWNVEVHAVVDTEEMGVLARWMLDRLHPFAEAQP